MKHVGRMIALVLSVVVAIATLSGCFGKEKEEQGNTEATTVDTILTTTQPTSAPTTAGDQPFTGYVNASTLRVRPTPDTTGEAIGGLAFGDTVNVIGREGDWYKIAFKDGTGYVSAQYIQDTVPTEGTAADTTVTDTTTNATDATTTATDSTEVVAP